MPNRIKNIRDLIAKNELGKVFDELSKMAMKQQFIDELIVLKSNFEEARKKSRIGIESFQDLEVIQNRIKNSILGILREIENNTDSKKEKPPSNVGTFDPLQVQHLIDSQKSSINYYKFYGIGIFVIGILIIAIGFLFQEGVMKVVMNIGGGFVSSLSTLPIKEIVKRKENIGILLLILNQIKKVKSGEVQQVNIQKMEDLIWKKLEATFLA